MSLPPHFLDELRARVRLSEVIGRRVEFDRRKSRPARGDWWACCPFHQEKSPSFHVDDRRGFYHCFGCHAKGDAVSFLREAEGMGFVEAVETLAGLAGVEMPARDPEAARRAERRRGLLDWMEEAVRFYRQQLDGERAAEARAYLMGRGLRQDTLRRFELGYAPPGRRLFEHLSAKGAPLQALVEAGLCAEPEDGGVPYDRFRDRIMFPIRDAQGRPVAFGGRAMAADARAKYLNSPETPLFDKSRTLYNLGSARAAAARDGRLVVVEGYMDAIALAEAGLAGVVAPLGTAVTAEQLGELWRVVDEPVLALDGDRAGREAALRAADLALPLLAAGKSLRVALLPDNRDPDDLIRSDGVEALRALLDAAEPLSALLWRREVEGRDFDSPERRAALDLRLRDLLARIPDRGLRDHYRRDFAERRAALFQTGRPRPAALARRWRARGSPHLGERDPFPASATRSSAIARGGDAAAQARAREATILLALARRPEIAMRWVDRIAEVEFGSPDLDAARAILISAASSGASVVVDSALLRTLERVAPAAAIGFARAGAPVEQVERGLGETLSRHVAVAALAREVREAEEALREGPAAEVDRRLREAAAQRDRDCRGAVRDDDRDESHREGLRASVALAKDLIMRRKKRRIGPNH